MTGSNGVPGLPSSPQMGQIWAKRGRGGTTASPQGVPGGLTAAGWGGGGENGCFGEKPRCLGQKNPRCFGKKLGVLTPKTGCFGQLKKGYFSPSQVFWGPSRVLMLQLCGSQHNTGVTAV